MDKIYNKRNWYSSGSYYTRGITSDGTYLYVTCDSKRVYKVSIETFETVAYADIKNVGFCKGGYLFGTAENPENGRNEYFKKYNNDFSEVGYYRKEG